MTPFRKKLIEVALPLEAINREAAREKSIRHGHPSTLHLWWARRPLAACRAVLFASLIDDPDQDGVPQALLDRIDCLPRPEGHRLDWEVLSVAEQRRQRLFGFIEQLVTWENSTNEDVLTTARELILAATDGHPPPVLDPFCGGGSIPLEAQRLGLEAHASDLNPVAVLITKALIEIPPRFANQPPVNPVDRQRGAGAAWKGAAGLAADVRYYGKWMRDEAQKRIGHLYPRVKLPAEQGGGEATVIAWLWARTVTCPNPACGARMPLARSFWLSTKPSRKAWVEPVVDRAAKGVGFEVRTGQGVPREGTVDRRGAVCLVCDSPVPLNHVRAEGKAGRMGQQLMAVVAEGNRQRVYVSPPEEQEQVALSISKPEEVLDSDLPKEALGFRVQNYGMTKWRDLFTARQLVALTTFSDLVGEARDEIRRNAAVTGSPDEGKPLAAGRLGGAAYADTVTTYLAIAQSRLTDISNALCRWEVTKTQVRNLFGRQAIPIVWDFAENNVFGDAAGDYQVSLGSMTRALLVLPMREGGRAVQSDAQAQRGSQTKLISTDPPYYDNVPYADLSDFFYVWLRRTLKDVYPDLFQTMLVPKTPELVADPFRHGGREKAAQFFEEGLRQTFARIRHAQDPAYPLTVYYAFKQAEAEEDSGDGATAAERPIISAVSGSAKTGLRTNRSSTGWETMLEGLIGSGFSVTGTWPMRSELGNRMRSQGSNALASSIVLVCRPRPDDAPTATRRELVSTLKQELPDALRKLQAGNIAPVDLAQAAIGPGMAVFSRYSRVVDASGQSLTVRQALQLINQTLDEVLSEEEGEFDAETRWAITWFEQRTFEEGLYGEAETLARARNVSVDGLVEAGIVQSRAGKVRLLRRDELPADWDPLTDKRLTVWEATQHVIRALEVGGEAPAGALLAKIVAARSDLGETARDLAYRLYQTCERKGWAREAGAYNGLVVAWPNLQAHASAAGDDAQGVLFG